MRSLLFVPGNRPDRFEKALASGADSVIVDLEDAVPAGEKEAARTAASDFARSAAPGGAGRVVRINGAGTPWCLADLQALSGGRLEAIMLPKAEDPAGVAAVSWAMDQLGFPESCGLLLLVESARGVEQAADCARQRRVIGLAFGSIDYALDLGVSAESEMLQMAQRRLVQAARLAELPQPIDGVCADVRSPEQLAAEIERARRTGFGGKLAIHPQQVEAINRGFSPSEAERAWAEKVVASYESATARGEGALLVDGRLVDLPVVLRARRILGGNGS